MKINAVIAALSHLDVEYAAGTSKASDNQYDLIYHMAKKVWPTDPYFKKISAKLSKTGRVEVKLPKQMRSLTKLRPKDAIDWLKTHPDNTEYVLHPKFDGVAILLQYENGVFKKAYTRGEDGKTGYDVTSNIKHMQGVLPRISRVAKFAPFDGTVFIGAECICHASIFDQHFSKLTGKGEYKNARNFVVGSVNRLTLDAKHIKALNKLTVVCYSLERKVAGKTIYFSTKIGELLQLGFWGFTTSLMPTRWRADIWQQFKSGAIENLRCEDYPPQIFKPLANYWHPKKSTITTGVLNHLLHTWKNSPDLDVLQDGVVLEINNLKLRQKYGFNDARPGFAMAVKPEVVDQAYQIGIVKHIEWNMSSRRIMRPVIVLKSPLSFDGVEVTRVNGYNAGFVHNMGLYSGSKVKVVRSGDVIPTILEVIDWPKKNS